MNLFLIKNIKSRSLSMTFTYVHMVRVWTPPAPMNPRGWDFAWFSEKILNLKSPKLQGTRGTRGGGAVEDLQIWKPPWAAGDGGWDYRGGFQANPTYGLHKTLRIITRHQSLNKYRSRPSKNCIFLNTVFPKWKISFQLIFQTPKQQRTKLLVIFII